MRRLMRRMPVLVLAAASVVVLAAVPATAATNVKSTVTIVSGEDAEFTGKVSAAKKKCRAGRTVKLFREGDSSYMSDALVGTAKTSKTGAWTMKGDFLAGVYYARVLAMIVHINGMAYRCMGDVTIRQQF